MGRKYNMIYADPPWQYKLTVGHGIAIDKYLTMDIGELKRLPV